MKKNTLEERERKVKRFDNRAVNIIFVVGFVLGVITIIVGLTFYNWTRGYSISEKGITILVEKDGIVRVPKGALIKGDAVEVVDLDGKVSTEHLKTPFTTTKSIMIKCGNGEHSVCIISLPADKYGVNYYHDQLVEKILK